MVVFSTPGNKTLQYYATEVLRFLRKLHLTKEWNSLPQNQQTLEKCTALIIQWFTPNSDLSWQKFAMQLDAIADEVVSYFCFILNSSTNNNCMW